VVFVQPGTTRKAVATSDETIVLSVGGRRGEAYRLPPGAELYDFFEHYKQEDWESALAACHVALEKHPGNALILYNIACMQSMLGRGDEALATLGEAVEKWPRFKENAQADDDFASLREDARFTELVA
jgi:tetratricopeptide (TPR) repeat protein